MKRRFLSLCRCGCDVTEPHVFIDEIYNVEISGIGPVRNMAWCHSISRPIDLDIHVRARRLFGPRAWIMDGVWQVVVDESGRLNVRVVE